MEGIVISLLTVTAFAKGWEDIELYGKTKKAWLKPLLPLKHGIPLPV
ncbi:MAG: transposase family protein [Treponema sp.]|nr:transposase family protein [Treponema sp.]